MSGSPVRATATVGLAGSGAPAPALRGGWRGDLGSPVSCLARREAADEDRHLRSPRNARAADRLLVDHEPVLCPIRRLLVDDQDLEAGAAKRADGGALIIAGHVPDGLQP